MVFGMCAKMLVKIGKPFGKQRDLDFGRPCITLVAGKLCDKLLFTFFFETHNYIHLLLHVGLGPSEPPVDSGKPRPGYILYTIVQRFTLLRYHHSHQVETPFGVTPLIVVP